MPDSVTILSDYLKNEFINLAGPGGVFEKQDKKMLFYALTEKYPIMKNTWINPYSTIQT
jgi:hypothetical protein